MVILDKKQEKLLRKKVEKFKKQLPTVKDFQELTGVGKKKKVNPLLVGGLVGAGVVLVVSVIGVIFCAIPEEPVPLNEPENDEDYDLR